ncbi:hypothetical protein NP493_272g03050 [Ridgeia piscesae]|uniref:G-protein coupled receptors family 1 profile domain-containing protein n=1 Tax=Ridgeia piscesae TaxID=27915 RepID=A0AAD9NXJ0_RIDPI|nr:hypothetical protein NP493_272g03050 [Ridgeia piscesae]
MASDTDTSSYNDTLGENLRESTGLVTIVYYLIGSVGILGNLLVIVVILNFRAMRSKNVNVLVLNQSFVDMLASVLVVAETHIDTSTYLAGVWGELVCRFWLNTVPLWSLLMASTINILVITLERYVAVVHPLGYRNYNEHAKRRLTAVAMASAWVAGFAFNMATTSSTSAVRQHRCYSMVFFASDTWKKVAGVAAFLFEFLIPLAICVVCYARIVHTLGQKVAPQTGPIVASASLQSQGSTVSRQTKAKMIRNVHKTFGIVVVCAIVLNTGNHCLFLAFNFGYPLDFTGALYHVSVIGAFANCCVNPFIYALKYKMFQQGLKRLFCRYKPAAENTSVYTIHTDCRLQARQDTPHV